MAHASQDTRHTLDNIQYQHECTDSAQQKRRDQQKNCGVVPFEPNCDDSDPEPYLVTQQDTEDTLQATEFTQRDVESQLAAQFSSSDRLYAEAALNIAMDQGIFDEQLIDTEWKDVALPASDEQMIEFQELEKLVDPNMHSGATELNVEPSVELVSPDTTFFQNVDVLNIEKRMAHGIIANHLAAHMDGQQPRQLLMMVIGQGGTGKSTLLNAITTSFERLDASHLLAKTALSGVVASLISGTTLHWFGGLPIQRTPQSDVWPDDSQKHVKVRRKKNILPPLWLAIDEVGMCTLNLLTLLSQVAGKVKVDDGKANTTVPFGGLNVLIMGDFHQFPPVGSPHVALYRKPVE
jgi:hypothetical protein